MQKSLTLLVLLFSIVINGFAQKQSLAPDLQSLVDREREFARTATEKGVRDSFLAFIADDGIIYRPGPVNGKEWLTPRPARPGLLTWQPVFAEISNAGDLGFTTGPWEFRQNRPDDPPIAFGQFSTVWRRQTDGKWKFVIDIGISYEKASAPIAGWQLPAKFNRRKELPKGDVTGLKTKLYEEDNRFSTVAVMKGAVKAYDQFGSEGIRLLRNGAYPIVGMKAAASILAVRQGRLSWQPVKADIASSGDLGYTYGNFEFKGNGTNVEAENGYYMRVWQKQSNGKWKVVLDVFNELPKPAAN
jgi:ketosteroid isomerase-like protein